MSETDLPVAKLHRFLRRLVAGQVMRHNVPSLYSCWRSLRALRVSCHVQEIQLTQPRFLRARPVVVQIQAQGFEPGDQVVAAFKVSLRASHIPSRGE